MTHQAEYVQGLLLWATIGWGLVALVSTMIVMDFTPLYRVHDRNTGRHAIRYARNGSRPHLAW